MEASVYGFRRPGGGLEGLHDWLIDQHLDAPAATFVTDTLWFYYWYFLWPTVLDGLPVEINAASEQAIEVFLSVPFVPTGDRGLGVPETDVSGLKEDFAREVVKPLGDEIRAAVRFMPHRTIAPRLDELVVGGLVRTEQEYSSVFVGDLLDDLRSLMPADALAQWIDTPNARLGGTAPRKLLRTPDKRFLRDLILEARHGLPT